METLALIIFLIPIVGGAIYFLALLVQGEITIPSLPLDQSPVDTQKMWKQYSFKDDDDPLSLSLSNLWPHKNHISEYYIHHYHDD